MNHPPGCADGNGWGRCVVESTSVVTRVVTESQNHRMAQVRRDLCGSSSPTFPAEAGSPTAGCTGPPHNHLQPSPGFPSRLPNLILKMLLAPSFQAQAQQGTGWSEEAKAVGALLCHTQKCAFFG